MGINDVFKKVFNVEFEVTGDDDIYEDEFEEEEEIVQPIREQPKRSTINRQRKEEREKAALPVVTQNGKSTVALAEPGKFNDAPKICDKLKLGTTVVVNMDNVEAEEAKKIFDFLSGAVYVLSADMKKIADNVFILAPYGVEIQTKMDKERSMRTSEVDLWSYED